MSAELTVSIAALEGALIRVLDEISRRRGDVVALSADHYWVLPPEVAYGSTGVTDASRLTVAQLSDDVEELAGMQDEERAVVPWHDLPHLVGILQRLAVQDLP